MQFLYMARRDKKIAEVLAVAESDGKSIYKRNLQTNSINLNNDKKFQLDSHYFPNRMDWELIVEEAPSYASLRENLKKRGYKFVPGGFTHLWPKSDEKFIK